VAGRVGCFAPSTFTSFGVHAAEEGKGASDAVLARRASAEESDE
jgi:hypothetical protein